MEPSAEWESLLSDGYCCFPVQNIVQTTPQRIVQFHEHTGVPSREKQPGGGERCSSSPQDAD